ncbi:MAG: Mu-like prophage major head subunit gpT family protein [Gammaproteobacteria bacterium]
MPNGLLDLVKEDGWNGWGQCSKHKRPHNWASRMSEAVRLIDNARGETPLTWGAKMEEAMGTDDFPLLMADTIDRRMLAAYQATPRVMRAMFRYRTFSSMRTVKANSLNGVGSRLQQVEVQGEYKNEGMSELEYTYDPIKWGRQVQFNWEAMLNDDIGIFDRIPQDLAQAAANTEEYFLTTLLFNAAGVLDSYFATADGGAGSISSNTLTIANLGAAIQEMAVYTDTHGEPILSRPRYLIVPPALEFTAREIITSTEKFWTGGDASSSTSSVAYPTPNVIASYGLKVIVNPWIPVIVTTGTLKNTTWALISDTVESAEFGELRGHVGPELFMRTGNQQRLGGGTNPMDGSFENDTIAYKVRLVNGGTTLDPRGGWASDGQ